MDMLELMKQRHSVRQYSNKAIETQKQTILNEMISKINLEKDLHIQVFYNEPNCFNSAIAHYGKFTGVKNYIALVGKKSSTLDETLGYYGEKLVLKIQELGLNSCWVALTHGKSQADILKNESQRCLIAFGYGCTNGISHKSKSLKEVCNYTDSSPKWFLNGMEAVLLAPTAMNQQKFYFELQSNDTVKATHGTGFYSKLDLGIVKYHFEIATQKSIS